MSTGKPRLREMLAEFASEVEAALAPYLEAPSDPARHYGMVRYHFGIDASGKRSPTGKRMRAVLALVVGRALGAPPQALRSLLAACELLHGASLVHDDIQDGDRIRWSRPTLWVEYGTSQAINVGDALLGMAYQALGKMAEGGATPEATIKATAIFSDTFVRMTEGQHMDLANEGNCGLGVTPYLDIIARKTAAACEMPTWAGAVIATSDDAVRERYRRFGHDLGVLYQICDDYAGIWGNVDETGKQVMNDVARRKASLPLILGYERGSSTLRYLLSTHQPPKERRTGPTAPRKAPDFVGAEASAIRDELTRMGVDAECRTFARKYRASALAALGNAPEAGEYGPVLRLIVEGISAAIGVRGDEEGA